MIKLSAIVFTYWADEESYIEACLKSISFADEIIVIDNGATPETIQVVKKYTNKIFTSNSKDFSKRHNLGTEKSNGQWLLYIDADERVSQALRIQIEQAIENDAISAYQLNRVNFFLGKKVRFGDRYPDLVTRLFQKKKLEKWTGEIHESSSVTGEVEKLSAPLFHITHRDIFSMVEKTINFSQTEAKLRLDANHPKIVWWRLLRVFLTEFWTRIVKYQGFRQGTEGWIDGIFQAFSLFIVYARLWELQRSPSLSKTYREIDDKILKGEL